jgi:hypothetical protein
LEDLLSNNREVYMGFVTNQWIKGNVVRNRKFAPVNGTVSAKSSKDSWSKQRGVVLEIRIERDGGDYHELFLTKDDIASLLSVVTQAADTKTRASVAIDSLISLSDHEVLISLRTLLSKRYENASTSMQ